MLSIAVVQSLIDNGYTGNIHVTCYETDKFVLPLLCENLAHIIEIHPNVTYTIKEQNYITEQTVLSNTLLKNNVIYHIFKGMVKIFLR